MRENGREKEKQQENPPPTVSLLPKVKSLITVFSWALNTTPQNNTNYQNEQK